MAFNDFLGGQGWSGHKAPDGTQSNPNNDPEIAASQERLRQFASLTAGQLTNPRLTGQSNAGTGDMPQIVQTITYDSPYGPVTATRSLEPGVEGSAAAMLPPSPTPDMAFRSGEKFWWQPGLAESVEFNFGPDGAVSNAKPRDTRYSFGEQLGDFAGNIVTMGAVALAAYGAAAGLGSAAGGEAAAGTVGAEATTGTVVTPVAAPGAITATPLAGAAPIAATSTGVLGTGLTASEMLAIGSTVYGATQSGGSQVSSTPAEAPVLEQPTAPPTAPTPVLSGEFYRQNMIENRNQTLLTDPAKRINHLIASGNTLLGA